MKRLRILCIPILLLSLAGGFAQDTYQDQSFEPAQIDEAEWEKKTIDRDYYEKAEPKPEEKIEEDTSVPFDWSSLSWMVYLLIGLLVALVVYLLVQVISAKQNTKVTGEAIAYQQIEDIDEDLDNVNLESFLERALREGNFRLAIRVLYLMALQEMERREWIDYRKDKTNFNYVMEMGNRPEGLQFTRLTKAFEIVWYGDFHLSPETFESLRHPFESYLTDLRKEQLDGKG